MLVFLHGENSLLSREKLSELRSSFLAKNPAGEGLAEFDLEDKDGRKVDSFLSGLGERSLFSSRRLIVAKSFVSNSSKEQSEGIIESLKHYGIPASEDVVVFWDGKEISKGPLFDFLMKEARCQRFERMDGGRTRRWISETAKKVNPDAELAPAVTGLLDELARTEDITQEVKKIATFKAQGRVELAEAEQLLHGRFNSRIFEAVGALLAGNRYRAADLLGQELASGQDPYYIFSMYAYQLRNLLKIAEAWESGIRGPRDIVRATGLKPLVVEKNLGQARNLALADIKKAFGRIAEFDRKIKTGEMDIRIALDLLVAGQ